MWRKLVSNIKRKVDQMVEVKNKKEPSIVQTNTNPIMFDINYYPGWIIVVHMECVRHPDLIDHFVEKNGVVLGLVWIKDINFDQLEYPPYIKDELKQYEKVWLIFRSKGEQK